MENLYCTIFIVDVSQNPEEVETVTSRITQLIEDHGGTIKKHDPWGKRRLAYPIENKTSGFYVEIEFTAQSRLNIPQIIEKEYRLNDRVMRYLTYVVTKAELRQRSLSARRAKSGENVENGHSETGTAPKSQAKPQSSSPKPVTEKTEVTAKPTETETVPETGGVEKSTAEATTSQLTTDVKVDENPSTETPMTETVEVEKAVDSVENNETPEKEEVKDAK